jgi:hypothetical protein
VATDYGGQAAYSGRAWQGGQPGSAPHYGPAAGRRRGRGRGVAIAALILGVAGLGVSLAGAAMQVLPRQFTAHQQRQILNWEIGKRWREMPAGTIFPAYVRYPAPPELGALTLTAVRIGIARQASCRAATDAAVAAVLDRNGCQAMLRATYADRTDSYVVTVGAAAFSGSAAATAAHRESASLARTGAGAGARAKGKTARVAPGVRTVRFAGTPAFSFRDAQRQISESRAAGTYIVFYTIGYADDRPQERVASDSYTYSEMTSFGGGVAQAVLSGLAKPPPPPHCPGTPGC